MSYYSNRISEAFQDAPELTIDEGSRIVIMSDCHRGDGSWNDSFAANRNLFLAALGEYNKNRFTYIELGDGDELWEVKDFAAITGLYKNVFALMARFYRDDRLYLLYGNHDMVKKDPEFVSENFGPLGFPGLKVHEGLVLSHSSGKYKIYLLHGHQADFFNDRLWKLSRFLVRYLWSPLESLGVNDPTSASQNSSKKDLVEQRLSRWAKEQVSIIVAGHTHRPVFSAPGEGLYFNSGSCVHREYVTAVEIKDGAISLVKWSQKVARDGTIYVGRDLLYGPEMLDKYFEKN